MCKQYTIKEVSQKFNLPSSTLRYYEQVGILTDVERTSSGQRIYLDKHINRLKTICCFKRTGMTIAQLQKFFLYEFDEQANIDNILRLLNEQKKEMQIKIEQLEKDYEHLQRKLQYYSDVKYTIEHNLPHPAWACYKKDITK